MKTAQTTNATTVDRGQSMHSAGLAAESLPHREERFDPARWMEASQQINFDPARWEDSAHHVMVSANCYSGAQSSDIPNKGTGGCGSAPSSLRASRLYTSDKSKS
jgi:hypothetical protein